ncbi:HDOD domain-containing protein [Desulfovibrio litoralis]|uniref:HD-like signal output (HDOD) domain, no enzymatic activity n=1 Tax=Desulfovibrio litoralis DSM 11393 TaxID=1121455 RepID=A0A1M7RVW9_9BACT|nr:HDOD domain-containing protein [Desulfovibrio litoralis]SHN50258.1 HD-like signal output (HDOD) domain, no enzymatic activity [Desulfovibrio litoralis DSM 11393]
MEDVTTLFQGKKITANKLPVLPSVFYEFSTEMASPNANADSLSAILSKDQTLAVKILKMVNSPMYGFSGRISSLKHAVLLLGANVLRGILISTAAFDKQEVKFPNLSTHSLACSQASVIIAKHCSFPMSDEFGVAGLLHDIGKLVIKQQLPDAVDSILKVVLEQKISYYLAEKQVLGITHAQVNLFLCKQWSLPGNLTTGMVFHHDPFSAKEFQEMALVVCLANYYAVKLGLGCCGKEEIIEFNPDVYRALSINESHLAELEKSITEKFYQSGLLS